MKGETKTRHHPVAFQAAGLIGTGQVAEERRVSMSWKEIHNFFHETKKSVWKGGEGEGKAIVLRTRGQEVVFTASASMVRQQGCPQPKKIRQHKRNYYGQQYLKQSAKLGTGCGKTKNHEWERKGMPKKRGNQKQAHFPDLSVKKKERSKWFGAIKNKDGTHARGHLGNKLIFKRNDGNDWSCCLKRESSWVGEKKTNKRGQYKV